MRTPGWIALGLTMTALTAVSRADPSPGVAVTDTIEVRGSGRIEGADGSVSVSTNATQASSVIVKWGALISGDVYCGPDGSPGSAIHSDHPSLITGSRSALSSDIVLDAVMVPDLGASAGNLSYTWQTDDWTTSRRVGSVSVSGSALVRVSGHIVIVANGLFTVSGSARVEIQPDSSLTIYARNGFRVIESGQLNANTGNPALCRVFGDGAQQMEVSGSSQCHAAIHAPDADLRIVGSGRLQGSFRGRSLYMEGGAVLRVDEGSPVGGVFAMEVGRVTAGPTPMRISFNESFSDPVVVCGVYVRSNTIPVVARVSNVNATGFDLWLQNPGDLATPVPDRVAWIAVEAGAWEVDGARIEAQRYTSTLTDRSGSWKAEQQGYLQAYTSPVVIGQVMTANDDDWSVFWARGSSVGNPPSSTHLYTGRHVGEDTDKTRADEVIGFIVFEQGHGQINGIPFDAVLTSDSVTGMHNNPPHEVDFYAPFAAAPRVVIASGAGMDGGDGAWPVMYGSPHATPSRANATMDEDVIKDSDRSHTSEQIAMVSFLTQGLLFEDVSGSSGFDVHSSDDDDWGSGLLWGDADNDGDLDAFVTGNVGARLLFNSGAGQFAGTDLPTSLYRQAALLDLDNDGDLDLFGMHTYASERALINHGNGAFSDEGHLGFMNADNMEGIAAADLNADGWCDILAFSQNGNWFAESQGDTPLTMVGTVESSLGLNDNGDRGNGDFCSVGDVNNDGHPDFFYHYNNGKLFVSNGDGTYTQQNRGISVRTGDNDKMGSAWGDYDNDGDLDLWVSRYDNNQRGYLWRNDVDWSTGVGSFTNVTIASGITDESGQRGCAWGDYDNDGDLDLYIVTRGDGSPNLLYQNNGDGTFVQVDVGAAAPGNGHDAVFVDFDNDGDLDLSVTQEGAPNTLLRNDTDDSAFLKVRILGAGSGKTNKAAIGVRVELWSGDGSSFIARREIGVARGYGGIEPLWLHFGGVDPDQTYTIRVYFTRGFVYTGQVTPALASTTIGSTTIPQMLTIDEAEVRTGARVVEWKEITPY